MKLDVYLIPYAEGPSERIKARLVRPKHKITKLLQEKKIKGNLPSTGFGNFFLDITLEVLRYFFIWYQGKANFIQSPNCKT